MPSLANIYCHGVPSGLTLTGEVYPDGSDTAAGTGLTVTEATNRKTTYVLNAGVSGLHKILLKSGSSVVWEGWSPSNLAITGDFDALKLRELAAIKAKTDYLPSEQTATAAKLTKYVQLLARKDAAIATDNATELTEINADGGSGGGGYANTTDSGEAIRDRGDAAWTTATSVTVSDKTGFKLASDGLDSVTATTPNGVASTFPTKLMQLWARFFGRVTRDSDEIKTYRSDGTTVATTQTYTASGSDEDVGAAS